MIYALHFTATYSWCTFFFWLIVPFIKICFSFFFLNSVFQLITKRPGELNRLSADGSILLKNGGGGGYGGANGFLHHQSSPAFQNHLQQQQQHNVASAGGVGQHPSQVHQSQAQQTAAALMMNGKSPSRDLGGGSTPVLKMTSAHNNTANTQVKMKDCIKFGLKEEKKKKGIANYSTARYVWENDELWKRKKQSFKVLVVTSPVTNGPLQTTLINSACIPVLIRQSRKTMKVKKTNYWW